MTTTAEREYKIQIFYGTGEHMLPVKGKPVTVPGFEHHRFFLHRPVYDITKDEHGNVVPVYSDGWAITEATTGKNLGRSADTKAEAIDHAKTMLDAHREEFEKEVKHAAPQTAHKEPWEMTREEYLSSLKKGAEPHPLQTGIYNNETDRAAWERIIAEGKKAKEQTGSIDAVLRNSHETQVERALASGKPVPAEVLKDYPELERAAVLNAHAETSHGTVAEANKTIERVQEINKGALIRDILAFTKLEKDSEAYIRNEKALGALHTYELEGTLRDLRAKQAEAKPRHLSGNTAENRAIHAWYDDTEEERKEHDRKVTIRQVADHERKEKPRFSIHRKASGPGRGRDLGADIVKDRRGRHLRL